MSLHEHYRQLDTKVSIPILLTLVSGRSLAFEDNICDGDFAGKTPDVLAAIEDVGELCVVKRIARGLMHHLEKAFGNGHLSLQKSV